MPGSELCGATTIFWPDDECVDVGPCILPEGHRGDHREADYDSPLSNLHLDGNTWENADDD